jgi:hypothetical protein
MPPYCLHECSDVKTRNASFFYNREGEGGVKDLGKTGEKEIEWNIGERENASADIDLSSETELTDISHDAGDDDSNSESQLKGRGVTLPCTAVQANQKA